MERSHLAPFSVKAPMMGVFFSPPEAPMSDTFSSSQSPVRQPINPAGGKGFNDIRLPSIRQIMSPPVSPATKPDQEPDSQDIHDGADLKDPELFPHRSSVTQADSSQPLFRPTDQDVAVETSTIDSHIQSKEAAGTKQPRPTKDEYLLAASFRQHVLQRYNADPQRYYQKELEYLNAYPSRFPKASANTASKRKADVETRGIKRQKTAHKSVVEKLPSIKRIPRSSPREALVESFDIEPTPKHKRKVSHTVPVAREDMDFRKVPDLSPPVSTMAPGKNLKIDWKGHPLDLSDDSDRGLLDEQEVNLASVLRLTAGQYLFAKRKIFERYVELARIGKDFNKTSAQAVCHIDVNKASKLWTAFEKVGWFDRKHFSKYL
ncbi:hypothetical protein K461DRAFT_275226 [Myriangium duriaei CBS 260.36]|uniref:SWIRM domain-containing protein n=1 Tax=Myriangium duriaei CBS 260.36 TaxID=1168546 RepID=A0A9P4J668_9PEZI|nr:hypothetical protein K461DRAFT_275226 [Myriangium duriaei CBS 260.36]